MSRFDDRELVSRVWQRLMRIGARTWLILGVVTLGIVGLLAWAGIAALSWLWAQAPMATETGKRLAGEAATRDALRPGPHRRRLRARGDLCHARGRTASLPTRLGARRSLTDAPLRRAG